MSEHEPAKAEETKELPVIKKKASAKKTAALIPCASTNLWQEFDNTFARFRNDFEDLIFPSI